MSFSFSTKKKSKEKNKSIYEFSFEEVLKFLGIDPEDKIKIEKLKNKNQKDKENLIYYFSILRDKYQDKDFFRYKAYVDAINKISRNNFPLSTNVIKNNKIAGEKITNKIIEILETGKLLEVENDQSLKNLSEFSINKNKLNHFEILQEISKSLDQFSEKIKVKNFYVKKRKYFWFILYPKKEYEYFSKIITDKFFKEETLFLKNVNYFNFQNSRILRIVLKDFSIIEIYIPFEESKIITEKLFDEGPEEFEIFVNKMRQRNIFISFFSVKNIFGKEINL